MDTPKYDEGDIVCVYEKGILIKARVDSVFAITTPISYALEFQNGSVQIVAESDILYKTEGFVEKKNCECGSFMIYGHENCHSFWCPAYKEEK